MSGCCESSSYLSSYSHSPVTGEWSRLLRVPRTSGEMTVLGRLHHSETKRRGTTDSLKKGLTGAVEGIGSHGL